MNTFFDKNGSFLGTTSTSGKRIMRVAKSKTLNSWTDCGMVYHLQRAIGWNSEIS